MLWGSTTFLEMPWLVQMAGASIRVSPSDAGS